MTLVCHYRLRLFAGGLRILGEVPLFLVGLIRFAGPAASDLVRSLKRNHRHKSASNLHICFAWHLLFCNDDHSRISTRSEWPILVVNLFGADRVRYCIEVHRGAIGCHVSINFHVAICIQEVFSIIPGGSQERGKGWQGTEINASGDKSSWA